MKCNCPTCIGEAEAEREDAATITDGAADDVHIRTLETLRIRLDAIIAQTTKIEAENERYRQNIYRMEGEIATLRRVQSVVERDCGRTF